jgi:hypothetical protein
VKQPRGRTGCRCCPKTLTAEELPVAVREFDDWKQTPCLTEGADDEQR